MEKTSNAETQATAMPSVLHGLESHSHSDQPNVLDAARALSNQVHDMKKEDLGGAASRALYVTGHGLAETPRAMVETVKKEGVTGIAVTGTESAAVGFGLRMLMNTPGAKVAEVATLALGTAFLAKTVPQFYNAYAQGESATSLKELQDAGHAFGRASGSLAVDSIVGLGGYHVGSGSARGLRALTSEVAGSRPVAFAAPEGSTTGAPEAAFHPGHAGESALEAVQAAEKTGASDRVLGEKSVVSPEHTISMRELAEKDEPRFNQVMENYYGQLQKAFPDASEIESMQTYKDYLHDKDFDWNMLVLNDKHGNVVGGIQSQVVDVGGKEVGKAVWAEHIWLAPEARTFPNFRTLLKTAHENWKGTGSDFVFMEFNDRAKMSWQQQVDDASAGLSPEARELIWGRVGLYVLGDKSGRVAPYAQPAMGDGAPVEYLSMGMAPLKGSLDGKTIPVSDYLQLMRTAHSTIPDVNLETDPTVLAYTGALDKLVASGEDRLSFARLQDTYVERLIRQRLAKPAQAPEAGDSAN